MRVRNIVDTKGMISLIRETRSTSGGERPARAMTERVINDGGRANVKTRAPRTAIGVLENELK